MKKAFILVSALVLLISVVGCKTAPKEGAQEPMPVAEPEVIPFGLTVGWNVDKIPYDDAWIKLEYQDIKWPKDGILVKEVLINTQAAERGFRPGDIIYLVDGKAFTSTSKFIRILSRLEPGVDVPVTVVRTGPDGKKELVDLSLRIPTVDIKKFDFPIIFGYKKNDYSNRWNVLLATAYNRRIFSSHAWGIGLVLPLYQRERIGNVITQRIFWIFKWRIGQEDDITI